MRRLALIAAAAGLSALAASAVPAAAGDAAGVLARVEGAGSPTRYAQYGYRRGYYGGRGYYGRGRGIGAGGVAAGVIGGLAAGALVGGAIASQQQPVARMNPEYIAYCARKYRSFDADTGTFLANDGQRYMCQ